MFPIIILKYLGSRNDEKIEKTLMIFLLQLKNYTKINNDIVYAFKEIHTVEPLQSYIQKFLVQLNSGIKFESAIESLKEKICISRFKIFLSNLQHCFLYGGNITELIERSYNSLEILQGEKERRLQETKGARTVLYILIGLNIFVYFTFINNNYENFSIMRTSIFGNLIIYWNFISIWLLIFLANKVKKLDY
jgi:Flp pilus assembly protein TadB